MTVDLRRLAPDRSGQSAAFDRQPRLPMRRRTVVCPHLRIDGAPVDRAQVTAVGFYTNRWSANAEAGRRHVLGCAARPSLVLAAGYVQDCCSSSWCLECPIRADGQ
jgi:hypothetical protein